VFPYYSAPLATARSPQTPYLKRPISTATGWANYVHFRPAGHHRGITSGIHTAQLPFLGVPIERKCKEID
jgi:hypothetical protein